MVKTMEMKYMKNKNTIIALSMFAIIGLILSVSIASAYRGDYTTEGPNCSDERHDEMELAFEYNDYDAWYSLMTQNDRRPRVVDVVTAENFETFVQAHEAGENGDHETAAQLRTELGLNNGNGPADGTGYKNGDGQNKGQKMQHKFSGDTDNNHGAMKRIGGQ